VSTASATTTQTEQAAARAAKARPAETTSGPGLQADIEQTALAVHGTVNALLRLAHGELALSGALALRALLLTVIALACVVLAVAVGSALVVALGLVAGLGWPGSLALCLLLVLLGAAVCWQRARRHLRGCGLSRTRARLATLWTETSA
jgi:uncharacterized membrane protein YqjE